MTERTMLSYAEKWTYIVIGAIFAIAAGTIYFVWTAPQLAEPTIGARFTFGAIAFFSFVVGWTKPGRAAVAMTVLFLVAQLARSFMGVLGDTGTFVIAAAWALFLPGIAPFLLIWAYNTLCLSLPSEVEDAFIFSRD